LFVNISLALVQNYIPNCPCNNHKLAPKLVKQSYKSIDLVQNFKYANYSDVFILKCRFLASRCSTVETCSFCSASVPFESPEFGFCEGENSSGDDDVKPHRLLRCVVSMQVCPITVPLWYCVCCHRSGFRLAPEPLFRMPSFHLDSDSFTKSSSQAVSPKPLCPFCGILLQRQQPDFLLSPRPV